MSKSDRPYRDEEWLHQKYHGERLSLRQVADEAGVEKSTIQRWMEKHGIKTRNRIEGVRERVGVNYANHFTMKTGYEVWSSGSTDTVHVHKLAAIAWYGFDAAGNGAIIENGVPWDIREENIHPGNLSGEDHPFYGVTGDEHPMGGQTGADHPNWKGGVANLPYPHGWGELAEFVRSLYDRRCQLCGESPDRTLDVHHMDGDKTNNRLSNLYPFCRSCHMTMEHGIDYAGSESSNAADQPGK